MRSAFERWYQSRYNKPISTSAFPEGSEQKRPDFIMLHVERNIEIAEIKKPEHALTDEEFDRMFSYFKVISEFLELHPAFKEMFPTPHIMLVCDGLALDYTHGEAYKSLEEHNSLAKKTWEELLMDTKKVYEDFIAARESGTS